jgi:WXXGXW repeat (2 copies)
LEESCETPVPGQVQRRFSAADPGFGKAENPMRNRFLRGLIPVLALAALPAVAAAGVFIGVSVDIAPPPLPVYVQPPCPEAGYLWAPGYWAWNDGGYYWVPGTWVLPPRVGLLWTPGYWGWDGGVYLWHAGYWGPHVGFYGGVRYGFGYDGAGFEGGYWRRGMFFYNRAVMHVGPTFVTNVYYHPVVYRRSYEHVSFNGGPGGIAARPTRDQVAFAHERHEGFTPLQARQQRMAFADRSLRADYNHGRPPIAATARPVAFHGRGAVAARAAGGPVHLTRSRGGPAIRADRPGWAAGQPRDGRPMGRSAPMRAQPRFARPAQRFGDTSRQRFESRPQNEFRQGGGGYRPVQRPQARSAPQYHQQFRPQGRAPAMRGGAREQPRGGHPHGPPPDHRGGGRDR